MIKDKEALLKQAETAKSLFKKKIRAKRWQGVILLVGVIIAFLIGLLFVIMGVVAALKFQWLTLIGCASVVLPMLIIICALIQSFNCVIFEIRCYRLFWVDMEGIKKLID
ncbi:MAG: hypothetical protein WC473_04325 [Patescibacteria group bacterium]|jgi:sterol desaturase/sphingolipid hydroxylase (fatty acid hydroxylase superfamily)